MAALAQHGRYSHRVDLMHAHVEHAEPRHADPGHRAPAGAGRPRPATPGAGFRPLAPNGPPPSRGGATLGLLHVGPDTTFGRP
jgi:hypothetical protein